jgi:hypothetical protein
MNKHKDERCCGSCIYYVEQQNDEGFCAFSWPPYKKAKAQPVSAYDSCDLFKELADDEEPINEISIVWVRGK